MVGPLFLCSNELQLLYLLEPSPAKELYLTDTAVRSTYGIVQYIS